MRRYSLLLVILGCLALAALLTWLVVASTRFGGRTPRPEPPAAVRGETVTHSVSPFTRLDVTGSAEVRLVQGAAEAVALPASVPRNSQIDAIVRDGTLFIRAEDDTRWWDLVLGSGGKVTPLVVTFRDLDAISTAGTVRLSAAALKVASLRIDGAGGTQVTIDDLTADQLRLSGAGALKADIAGTVARQTVTISGAGDYHGERLVSQDAVVNVAGAGKVVVNAQKTLKATISGAGSVVYLGDPVVTKSVSGAGSVHRREAGSAGIGAIAAID